MQTISSISSQKSGPTGAGIYPNAFIRAGLSREFCKREDMIPEKQVTFQQILEKCQCVIH